MNMNQLIEQWYDENFSNCIEGFSGVKKLENLCNAIGYEKGDFLGQNMALTNFLADNPGAIEAVIEWIGEQESENWEESISATLSKIPSETDEEEAEEEE